MKCPSCGSNDAYIGFTDIDCPNHACKNFKGAKTITPPAPAPIKFPAAVPLPAPVAAPAPVHQAPTGVAVLTVTITNIDRKRNSVEITFVGDGDPGAADKKVRFLWADRANPGVWNVCTLSNYLRYYVDGVDADGQTTYSTHWRCTYDGLMPQDPWDLTAEIFV